MRHGRNIVLEQRPRAESDIAVAAASIIAREGFINWLERKGKELGMRLERGVSPGVKETAKKLVELNGPQALREVAKVHFRTAHEIAPEHYAAPPAREDWRRRTSPNQLKRYRQHEALEMPASKNCFFVLHLATGRVTRNDY